MFLSLQFTHSNWSAHSVLQSKNVLQGSETSGRNRFLPGRMEETGKKVFLPVSSGRNWKKVEETGRNIWNQQCMPTKCWKKVPRYYEVILEHQCWSTFFSKFWHFARVCWLFSNDCMPFGPHLDYKTKHINFYISFFKMNLPA